MNSVFIQQSVEAYVDKSDWLAQFHIIWEVMPKVRSGLLDCMHGPENTFTLSSPIGNLELICCAKGVHALNLSSYHDGNSFKPITE